MRKLCSLLTLSMCVMAVVWCSLSIRADAANITTGTLGDNNRITWTYDEDTKTLTITGEDSADWWDNDQSVFVGICPDVETIVVEDCTVYSCYMMFAKLENLQSVVFNNFNTSQVMNMSSMFKGCSSLSSLDVSGFVTTNVNDMSWMFDGCSSLNSLDVSDFVTTNVTDMSFMFQGCSSLNSLDVSGFETSKVTRMNNMFNGCSGLNSLDVSNFDTSQVTDMSGLFYGCSGLSSLDVSNFDTSQVTDMSGLFNRCSGLSSLDVSMLDTSQVTDMMTMFYGCEKLSSLNVSGFDTSKVTNMTSMFCGCEKLSSIDVSKFNTSSLQDMSYMFYGCSGLKSLDLSKFDLTNVVFVYDETVLSSCNGLEKICTPKNMPKNLSIELPANYIDLQGNIYIRITGEVCGTTLYRQDSHPVVAFAERMYTVALERESDPSGIEYWTKELLSKRKDGAAISVGFIMSDEFNEKNYSNEEYIKVLYRTFFDREADKEGYSFWLKEMKAGRSRKSVLAGFVNSKEFTGICESYGITRGTMADDATATGAGQFVERLYIIAMERRSDPAGLEDWAKRINNKTNTPEQVAKEFFLSPEYAGKKTSNEKYVETLYLVFMDRTSEKDGKAYWVEQLNKGVSRESVLEGFADSEEFKEIMAGYGL